MGKELEYGKGHPKFLEYVQFIVKHENYEGMPDIWKDDGGVQWEAPSNRKAGKFKDTHHRRREWWRQKAIEAGIGPESPHWISKTAKAIHPTKKKPCKVCGRIMDIRYAYPSHILMGRLRKLSYMNDDFSLDPLEHIIQLITRLVEQFRDAVFKDLPSLFKAKGIEIPSLNPSLDEWLQWIDNCYIPSEPATLSPGAMSNAPDRLDGFHSFNLCCRSTTDKGRSKTNLQSYVTDRRVFEYWVDGNWIAADRLMGLVRSLPEMQVETCLFGHPGPCTADHIGPISLGFCHRPEFQLLCHSCNSAKNNRMFLRDVEHLRSIQETDKDVASWYSKKLWNLRKDEVYTEETALRLSKLLRDMRHNAMFLLKLFADRGYYMFLTQFLGLRYAEQNPGFIKLRIENHKTVFDNMNPGRRVTKYTVEQKARRIRVAFAVLDDYVNKENRNAFIVGSKEVEQQIKVTIKMLSSEPSPMRKLDATLAEILGASVPSEEKLRAIVQEMPKDTELKDLFERPRMTLEKAISYISDILSSMWENERYVRTKPEELL